MVVKGNIYFIYAFHGRGFSVFLWHSFLHLLSPMCQPEPYWLSKQKVFCSCSWRMFVNRSSLQTLSIPDKIKRTKIRTLILGLICLLFPCRFIRTVGYRWIIRWLCGYMGWGNTRPLPACIYQNIRTRYATPHRQLTGYRND